MKHLFLPRATHCFAVFSPWSPSSEYTTDQFSLIMFHVLPQTVCPRIVESSFTSKNYCLSFKTVSDQGTHSTGISGIPHDMYYFTRALQYPWQSETASCCCIFLTLDIDKCVQIGTTTMMARIHAVKSAGSSSTLVLQLKVLSSFRLQR